MTISKAGRTVWVAFLFVLLLHTRSACAEMIRGLDRYPVISPQQAAQLSVPQGSVRLMLGNTELPYDAASNTYFIPQERKTEDFDGEIVIDEQEGFSYFVVRRDDFTKQTALDYSVGLTVMGVNGDLCVSSKIVFTHLVTTYAVGLLVLFMAAYALQQRAISRFSRQMQRQMDDVRLLLEGDHHERRAVFPEFQPAISNIAYLAKKLNADIEEVRRTMNLRSDFVANASHELRSPLTSIMGFAEMIDEGLADTPEEQKMCIGLIRNECSRMLGVIEDILLLSRAEKQVQHVEKVDVRRVAQEIAEALLPRAQQKDIDLSVHGELCVLADEKAIWEILYNLIDNAIHYGKTGGYVRIGLLAHAICVEDNGIGIEQKHIPHLFEQFFRVDEAREMAEGGSGLGLSIVKTLVTRCGAQIHVTANRAGAAASRWSLMHAERR